MTSLNIPFVGSDSVEDVFFRRSAFEGIEIKKNSNNKEIQHYFL